MLRFSLYFAFAVFCLVFFSCRQNPKSVKARDLDSISDAMDIEFDSISNPIEEIDEPIFTTKDWDDFETALNKSYKTDIYLAYTRLTVELDSFTDYDLESKNGFLSWLEKLKQENSIEDLTKSFSKLDEDTANQLHSLVMVFVQEVKTKQSTIISKALNTNIQELLASNNFSPPQVIDKLILTLGKESFKKEIGRLTATCYLLSILQVEP